MKNALYVWDDARDIDHRTFKTFSKDNNIRKVFLTANRPDKDMSDLLINFQGQEMDFYAMASTNEFALNHSWATGFIENVVRFNQKGKAVFKGIHFDIEPYTLPGYDKKVLGMYLSMVEKCNRRSKDLGLEFGLSIPFWFKKETNTSLITNSDHISVMAYRSCVEEIVDAVKDHIRYSDKEVYVAVDNLTFLRQAKIALKDRYGKDSVYKGVAVHHYKKFQALSPKT